MLLVWGRRVYECEAGIESNKGSCSITEVMLSLVSEWVGRDRAAAYPWGWQRDGGAVDLIDSPDKTRTTESHEC